MSNTKYVNGEVKNRTFVKLNRQSYDEIREQCLRTGTLFEDPFFPATMTSIGPSTKKTYDWRRPGDIVSNPKFIVDGASRFDIDQGEVGNCWFVAALASLSMFQEHFDNIIPPKDCLSFKQSEGYAGVFRFHFWSFGEWTEVVVDDRLPTERGRLIYLRSPQSNEFWSSLLEKAYAKLNGSYENLDGGSVSDALEDFTGGVIETFDFLTEKPKFLFKLMQKAAKRQSLMGTSINGIDKQLQHAVREGRLPNGLITGHAYSVTGIKKVMAGGNPIELVRLRNPWGNEEEWKGAWSDKSPLWNTLSKSELESMELQVHADGEFWMSIDDYSGNFTKLEICHLGPEYDDGKSAKKCWERRMEKGSWKKNINAGGCHNNKATFFTNPQFRVTVSDPDEDDDDATGTLVVAVLQRRKPQQSQLLTIGYYIYKLEDPNCGPLDANFFKRYRSAAVSPFINRREVCGRHKLAPGHYCIIPTTFHAGKEGDFVLRVFTEKPVTSKELDEDTAIQERDAPKVPETVASTEINAELYKAFQKIAGDDLEIDADRLQSVLNSSFNRVQNKFAADFNGFSLDTCRSLVAIRDLDHSGKLGFSEFKELWVDLAYWKNSFRQADEDGNGTLNSYELRSNLHDIGISVSNALLHALVERFSDRDGTIYFDDYIHCIAKLSAMSNFFKSKCQGAADVKLTMSEFLTVTMYS